MNEMKYIQLVTFRNTATNTYWLFNLELKTAVYLRGSNLKEFFKLGFEAVDIPSKIMGKVVKNVRTGFYPSDTNLKTLLLDFHPELFL